ncbi:hypothetical protein SporoP37_16440 (plasmid) [Sporosarcina sp. P37]|uniref:hypothetical protein n=1 Tax=unclassified Sporosarcina TaxID=2647733 RepID=UPI000A17C8D9|nr:MULTISPECIES: hypothetical protein [unclassified Sporosarcina]ARK26371.1 hypothetical protein SporoP37_16440 [Sporosarcina sp. P37]
MKFDISGEKYGYLTANKDSGERRSGGVMWECRCVCSNKTLVSYGDLTSGHTKSCGCKHRRSGEDHHNWSGSSEVKHYLRNHLMSWKFKSLKFYGRKCVITGTEKQIEVHHLNKSFIGIFKEALEFHDLPELSSVGAYTSRQLEQLTAKVISLHFEYGLGVPISHKLHKEFHSLYGHSTTPAEFNEFVSMKEKK